MFTITGKYTTADVKVDDVETTCVEQLQNICDTPYFEGSTIKIMPDCHAGKGSVIGFTCKTKDKVSPSIVGVDISCSISGYKLNKTVSDFTEDELKRFDDVVHTNVKSGMNIWEKGTPEYEENKVICNTEDKTFLNDLKEVCDTIGINYDYAVGSLGSLGSGNHFQSLEHDKNGNVWLLIHCGSRNLGKRVCEYHQKVAVKRCIEERKNKVHEEMMKLEPQLRGEYFKSQKINDVDKPELCYLEGEDLDLYTKHMLVAERFARLNHYIILTRICKGFGCTFDDSIFTHHNYIEFLGNREMIIRKGSISAYKNERVIIPLNMRDGTLIGVGKGNEDWNCSAPHGAGRVLSRGKAKNTLTVDEFKETMTGIYSSCVCEGTLDESPMAYKDYRAIMDAVGETVDIEDRLLPIYNFKATD